MKYHFIVTALFIYSIQAGAQLRIPVPSAIRSEVQKVIEDYPGGFSNSRTHIIVENPQTIEYATRWKPSGAEEASVVQYSSGKRAIYTWQALMLSTESFEEAVKQYKWLYTQIKGMNVKYIVDMYTLEGKYYAPEESKKFTVSALSVTAAPPQLKKLKVEVAMQYEFPEWKVKLLVYDKEREDDERGDIND
ncbi:MAG: hypothetical protein M3413_01370 [Bacteroidota bacterium]|jgi:hypothetical protein|nr:hypothetical protein [Bacteroidota bacterium]